jgi:hypothetical protein
MNDTDAQNDFRLQDALIEHVEALWKGPVDPRAILRRFGFDQDAEWPLALMELAERIHQAIPVTKPSDEFVERLYKELMETEDEDLIAWMRKWPRPVQVAAGLTFTAGMLWVARRAHRGALEFLATQRNEDEPIDEHINAVMA